MLRRLFVVWFLTLLGLVAVCAGESANTSRNRTVVEAATACKEGRNDRSMCQKVLHPLKNSTSGVPQVSRTSRILQEGSVLDDDGVEDVSSRKKKGKGYGKILVYVLGATKATMLYIMIHAVAAVAGKALVVAKVALAIATAVALKKAFDSNDKTSYEIIKHPHHSYVQTHSTSVDYDHHDGYGESGYGGHRKRRRVHR